MGFWDNLNRAFDAQPPEKAEPEPKAGELGRDGEAYEDFRLGGPDINPEMSGRAKYQIYEEMRVTDPAIRSLLLMFKLPIQSATWSVEPASEAPEDAVIAEAVSQQFGLGEHEVGWMNVTWEQSLSMCLQYLDFGSMFEEIVWGEPFKWSYEADEDEKLPGGERLIRPIAKLGIRKPQTIAEIESNPDGTLNYLLQEFQSLERQPKPIPGHKLIYYINEREDNGWFGTSIIRSAFGPWRLKKALLISAGIGYDRYAAGVPLIRYPAGGGDNAKRKADSIGFNYRTHERAWISLPGMAPPQGDWDVSILSGNGTIADPVPFLRHLDEQIATAALQGFTRLGVTETGSRAVGEVLADPYYLAVQAVARYVKTQREKYLIARFVRVNFGDDAKMPKVTVSKISADNIAQVVEAIANLSGASWNMSDRALQNLVRTRLGLPELPEEEPTRQEGGGLGLGGVASAVNPAPVEEPAAPEEPPAEPPAEPAADRKGA